MTIHIHHLTGCAPTPLAHYLKALGILRLVATQKDANARGWWQDEAFHLATTLDRAQLERFFLDEYAPTPVVAPWNKGSGFVFAANNPALAVIEQTLASRFRGFREAIGQARTQVGALAGADAAVRVIKDRTKDKNLAKSSREAMRNDPLHKAELAEADRRFNRLKEGLIPQCRREWRGLHLRWLDTALVLTAEGVARFPALLGSGGNDGKNDFTKQFMESLVRVLVTAESRKTGGTQAEVLQASLHAQPDIALSGVPVGQFLPGGAGGANMSVGTEAGAFANPWDYVLLIEGTLVICPSVIRRIGSQMPTQMAAPFTVRTASCGYASASSSEKAIRGEQWMPLWSHPCTLGEVHGLFAEGRAQCGRAVAARPVDFARSVARLGVVRGIGAFQRFGYLERNGQANLAVPLGRWQVTPQPHQELLNDLDRYAWMDRMRHATADEHAPGSLKAAHREVDEAIMAVCARGGEPPRWQGLLRSLAEAETQLVQSGSFTKKQGLQPLPILSGGWLAAADDGSAEFRLAVALALQAGDESGGDSVRRHWLPLDKSGRRFATDAGGLRKDPRVVCHGLDPERDLIALVQRRLIEGAAGAGTRLRLAAAPSLHACLADIALLLEGQVDLARTVGLARALMALNRRELHSTTRANPAPAHARGSEPPPLYGLVRLACLPWPLARGATEIHVRCDPAMFARLAAGDLESAGDIAIRRLRAVGLIPILRHVTGDPGLARRLAVSLAFPICQREAARLAERLTKPQPQE